MHYSIRCLSTAVSPISHAKGTVGNEIVINRQSVYRDGSSVQVPIISGNCLRHIMLRRPGAEHLVEVCGLSGQLDLVQLNFLFHGGALTEKGGRENLKLLAAAYEMIPLLHLLGGSFPGQIVPGTLKVQFGRLVCEENRRLFDAETVMPAAFSTSLPKRLESCEYFIGGWQYTRGDARKSGLAKEMPEGEEADTNLMIMSGQCVLPGAVFWHGFDLSHAEPVHLGCLLHCLSRWRETCGAVGRQSARGHGRLDLKTWVDGVSREDQRAAVQAYLDHTTARKDDVRGLLAEVFKAPPAGVKPAKGKAVKPAAKGGSLLSAAVEGDDVE